MKRAARRDRARRTPRGPTDDRPRARRSAAGLVRRRSRRRRSGAVRPAREPRRDPCVGAGAAAAGAAASGDDAPCRRRAAARGRRAGRRQWAGCACTTIVPPTPSDALLATPGPTPSDSVRSATPAPTANARPGGLIAFIRPVDKHLTCSEGETTCPVSRLWIVGTDGSGAHELLVGRRRLPGPAGLVAGRRTPALPRSRGAPTDRPERQPAPAGRHRMSGPAADDPLRVSAGSTGRLLARRSEHRLRPQLDRCRGELGRECDRDDGPRRRSRHRAQRDDARRRLAAGLVARWGAHPVLTVRREGHQWSVRADQRRALRHRRRRPELAPDQSPDDRCDRRRLVARRFDDRLRVPEPERSREQPVAGRRGSLHDAVPTGRTCSG